MLNSRWISADYTEEQLHDLLCDAHLVRIVLQRAVITLVTNSIQIGVFLIHIVQIRTVILFIQNTLGNK